MNILLSLVSLFKFLQNLSEANVVVGVPHIIESKFYNTIKLAGLPVTMCEISCCMLELGSCCCMP